ncbi:MAG: hypothetical protein ACRDST_12710 [Pseudonocardiaceae bacterium]
MTDAHGHDQFRMVQDRPTLPKHLQDQAQHAADAAGGRSADDALAELIADLDATAPDPYPGDEAYQAQLARQPDNTRADHLQESLHDRDIAAPASAGGGPVNYDDDPLTLRHSRQATQEPPIDGRESPGKTRAAEAVATAHAAVQASEQTTQHGEDTATVAHQRDTGPVRGAVTSDDTIAY